MKVQFVLEKFEKHDPQLGASVASIVQLVKGMKQSIQNQTPGDSYEFKFVFPVAQLPQVQVMLKDFKGILITSSKTYAMDDKTGVVIFRTIGCQEKPKETKKIINEILEDDLHSLLHIKHPDEMISKFSGMKIKYFDNEEWLDYDNLFNEEEGFKFDED